MKSWKNVVFGALVALAFVNPCSAQYPPPVDIPIQNILQETPAWCWVAVAQQVILAAAGPQGTPYQCALVAIANGAAPEACCSWPNPACVRTGSLEQIQFLIGQFGRHTSTIAPPTDPLTLYNTLASRRPIILHIVSGPGTSHVVVLRGMAFVPTPQGVMPVLYINDPMSVFTQPVPYPDLQRLWISAIVVN